MMESSTLEAKARAAELRHKKSARDLELAMEAVSTSKKVRTAGPNAEQRSPQLGAGCDQPGE